MWLAGQCSINHLSSEKLESVLRIRLDIKNCIVYFWENRVLARVELGEDCAQHILERACAAEDGALSSQLASSAGCCSRHSSAGRTDHCFHPLPCLSLPEGRPSLLETASDQGWSSIPPLPATEEKPCSMERLDAVLAEALVLHGDLGMEARPYSYKKLKHL